MVTKFLYHSYKIHFCVYRVSLLTVHIPFMVH